MQEDNKEKFIKKIGHSIDNYNKARRIEQAIPYNHLRNMNVTLITNIVKNVKTGKQGVKDNLLRMSYSDLIGGVRMLTVNEDVVMNTYKELGEKETNIEAVAHVCSLMYKMSRETIGLIVSGDHVPLHVAKHITVADMYEARIELSVVNGAQSQLSMLLDGLVSSNMCHPLLIPSNVLVTEKNVIIEDTVVEQKQIIMSGVPVRIEPRYRRVANLYMRFQLFASSNTLVYSNMLEALTESMDDIIEFVNSHSELMTPLFELYKDRNEGQRKPTLTFDDNDIFELFHHAPLFATVASSSMSRLNGLSDDLDQDLVNMIRIGKSSWIAKTIEPMFNIEWNPNPYTVSIVDSVQNSILEEIYITLQDKFPMYMDNLKRVTIGSDPLTLVSQHETLGVYISADTTSMLVNGVMLNISHGDVVIVSSSNAVIKIEDGIYVWYH